MVPDPVELARSTLAQQHPLTATWSDPSSRLTLLAEEHALDVRMATDRELALQRRDRFAPDEPIDLFRNSWEPIRPDLHAMLSMRYEGGDPGLPFVDASALSRAVHDHGDIAALTHAATQRFGVLRPRYLRWWSSEPAGHFLETTQDKRFLAAPLADLARRSHAGGLTLRPAPDLRHYDDARRAYSAVRRRHPDHAHQAALEAAEDLEKLRREGLLFDVLLDARWCGYVAAAPGHRLGLRGYKITELVLTESARGRGMGTHLTTLLAHALLDRGHDADAVLIGTIHHDNAGALRAARQAGRHDIGGWVRSALATRPSPG